jgi:NAD(P)-dependent dehydrogenase (short-subunit alcohol dehydrogenase family)
MGRYEIEGKVVLITGAAKGIGRDTARRLADRGAQLALVDLDSEGVERAAAEIGHGAEPFVADVADRDSIAAAIGAARKRFGGIDVAMANAGISGTPQPSTLVPDEEFERIIRINLLGVWWTLKHSMPDVIERKGYLLGVASLAAAVPTPLIAAYGASKAAVHSLGRTLRFELAHTGAKAGTAYFAEIDTDMTRVAHKVPIIERTLKSVPEPLHRVQPVEVASKAVVRGIEKRTTRITVPRWVNWTVTWNGLGRPFEALAARDPRFVRNWKRAHVEAAQQGQALPDAAELPETTEGEEVASE